MPEFQVKAGRTVEVDKKGYLLHYQDWDEEVAAVLAKEQGTDKLTDEHWKLIRFLRQYYIEHGRSPYLRLLLKETDFKLKRLYKIFPSGPEKGLQKITGLPDPDTCTS